MTEDKHQMLKTAKEAAQIGGELLLQGFGQLNRNQIDLKGMGDYVTDLDHLSEEAIIRKIKQSYPDHIIHAEESGEDSQKSPYRWLIDPLDGTANYVHNIPVYAVSIALTMEDEIEIGVVHYPERKEMFWAVAGEGAFLNGRPIHVSSRKEMAYSMLATGFPWRSKPWIDPYMDCFKDLFIKAAGLRRMGSAAIDLAYTAWGRFDGFWEMKLSPWDIAAGIVMVREAGGVVTDFRGENNYLPSGNVVAGNPDIHRQILEVTRRHLSEIR